MSEETETKQVKTFAVSNPGAAGFDHFELTDEGKKALMSPTEEIKKEHLKWQKITYDGQNELKDKDYQKDPMYYDSHVDKINRKLEEDGRDAIRTKIHSIFLGGRKKRKTRRKSRRAGGRKRMYRVKAVKAWLKRTKRRRKKRKTKKKKKRKRRRTRR